MRLVSLWVLLLGGCAAAEGDVAGESCTTSSQCRDGLRCVDSRCVNVSRGGDGGPPASGADGATLPACVRGDECASGACVDGECCPSAESLCGDECCGGGEVCFANECVVPGADCLRSEDCDEDQYCEPGLGAVGPGDLPTESELCVHEPPAEGRCVDLPPTCDEAADGEDCVESCEYRPDVERLNAVVQWSWGNDAASFEGFVDVWSTPILGRIADSNCDGRLDDLDVPNLVFVAGDLGRINCQCNGAGESTCLNGVLRVLDGETGEEVWSQRRPVRGTPGFAGVTPALGDMNGDGRPDIVAVDGAGHVVVLDGEGTLLARAEAPLPQSMGRRACTFGWGGALALGDMNGDGTPEVAYASTVLGLEGDRLVERFSGVGGAGGPQNSQISFFADVDVDGALELVAGSAAFEADGTPTWVRDDIHAGTFPGVGDFDRDGKPEVVAVSHGQVFVLEGATGRTIVGPFVLGPEGNGGPPTIADFDGDGYPEIGVAQQYSYWTLKPHFGRGELNLLWTAPNHDNSSSVTGSTVFDFEGDGRAEVVYADECFLWVYDGPTGDIRFATSTSSFTATEAPIVGDVDGDGRAEIVIGANRILTGVPGWGCNIEPWNQPDPANGRPAWEAPEGDLDAYQGIRVFRDSANGWVGTRSLWNQHAYAVSNVCDEGDDACTPAKATGTIPAEERPNWSVPWLNNFRQNVQGEGIFDAPDATVSLAVECTEPLLLRAAVRNAGESRLPAGVEVEFVRVDGAEETVLGSATTTRPLRAGQAEEVELMAPAEVPSDAELVARILNDPSRPSFRECREGNNASPSTRAVCVF